MAPPAQTFRISDKGDGSRFLNSMFRRMVVVEKGEMNHKSIIEKQLGARMKTDEGFHLKMGAYKIQLNGITTEHALVYRGEIVNPREALLLRINSACYTGDVFGCTRCDCSWQLRESIKIIHNCGGLLIYHFHHEGRGIGFLEKIKSYVAMDELNISTHDAFQHIGHEEDERRFFSSVLILKDLGISQVRLLSNNPMKKEILEKNGIKVVDLLPLISPETHLKSYLVSKKEQFGHKIDI